MAGKTNKLLDFERRKTEARQPRARRSEVAGGAQSGTLVAVSAQGEPLVEYAGVPGPLAAKTLVDIEPADRGRAVILMFENADARKPVVIGFVKQPRPAAPPQETLALEKSGIDHVVVDGQTVNINAENQIVIQCGQASITLKKSGQVIIKGTKIVSHAKGVNKVKGAAVSIN